MEAETKTKSLKPSPELIFIKFYDFLSHSIMMVFSNPSPDVSDTESAPLTPEQVHFANLKSAELDHQKKTQQMKKIMKISVKMRNLIGMI